MVVEKDDTVLRYAKDGSSVRALSITEHILSDAGVRSSGIISIPFAALTQTVTFDSVRVRKHSGEVIETPAGDAQEVPMPVTQAAPMYSDLRMKQLPVKSLSVGDTVEYRLSMKDTNADAPGRLLVCDGLYIGHAGEGGDAGGARPACTLTFGEGQESAASGERRGRRAGYRWKHETASEYPKKQETDKTAPLNTVQAVYEPDVAMTSFHTWAELGAWIYFKQNKLPQAESYVRSAWLLLMNPEGGLHMGKIYEAEGKKDEALTAYRLAVKAMGQRKLPQTYADMKTDMEARAGALTKAGVQEKPGPRVQQGGDALAALRTYTIPSPLEGQYASADFLLLLGDNRAEDVRFLKGDDVLKKAAPAMLAATYRSPLPTGSKAKVLRRGIVACTTGSKTCLLVLLPAAEARMD